MKHTHHNSQRNSERGQSLPELAISMTILVILLLGAFDFGRAFFTWIALRDAAQEGAAFATSSGLLCGCSGTDSFEKRAKDTSAGSVGMLGLSKANISVKCNPLAGNAVGDPIMVTTQYKAFPITAPFLGTIIGTQSITITASIRDAILVP